MKELKEYKNIREIIRETIRLYPDNKAFIIKNKDMKTYTNITYKQLGEEINQLGTALIKIGFKNKKIAVIGKNRYEWALSYYAVVNGVGCVVPLDKGLPQAEIESSIERSRADLIICEESYLEMINEIYEKGNTKLSCIVCMNDTSEDKIHINLSTLLQIGKKELENNNREYIDTEIDDDATSILLFTSGTTSLAKAVELSHRNIATNVTALHEKENIYPTDVNMAFLPFHHTFGSTGLLFFVSIGACTVFCDGLRHVQNNLKEYKVSVFFCVPLIIEAMHKKIMAEVDKKGMTKKVKLGKKLCKILLKFGIDIRRKVFKEIIDNLGGNLRFVISGAAAIDPQVAVDFNDFGILTVQGYGLTETSPVLTAENEYTLRKGSIGKPLYNVEIKIDNPNENGIGEIIAKGPNVMKGYYENEEATNEVLIDGWFHTGDLGYMDKDGYIYISGRKKNVIVLKNGKNIYPEELEIVVANLPYVAENMVFGIPKDDDLLLGVKIVYNKDYVEKEYPGMSNEDELKQKIWEDIKEINKGLPTYKHIKQLIITTEPMIKTTTNKVKRNEEIKLILSK
ncbi:MAG: long-chain fatty acid--CoA ligase [Clostridiales bacterium]|nr:long-chain fatty acid--CoA ligase [Clostridiales bacterium]